MSDITKQTAQMWKYISAPSTPEPHSEYDSQYAVLPGCKVIAARVRGKKHKHDGSNCDDWFEIGFVDDWTIIAVADGAGSKKFSRIGAKVASQTAINYIISSLSEFTSYKDVLISDLKKPINSTEYSKVCSYLANILQNSFSIATKEIEKEYKKRKEKPEFPANLEFSDFSTTLILTLVIPLDINEKLVITVQVGDGAAIAFDTKSGYEKAVKVLSNSDDKSKFAGETEFITSVNVLNANELMLRTKVYRGRADFVMLMTDGVSDDYFPYEEECKRLYLDLLANMVITNRKKVTDTNITRFIPRPVSYPWVNDPKTKIALQYVNKMCQSLGKPLSFFWNNQGVLSYYTRYISTVNVKDKGERLLMWLDNYVERGSFDDRTLVILEF
ncbi:hypothetical protein FACS1894132_02510 [Clostridia bacterium]|nr:hypothetical protein FACS1894132_02510 [Clostridia bacterium]